MQLYTLLREEKGEGGTAVWLNDGEGLEFDPFASNSTHFLNIRSVFEFRRENQR